MTRLSASKIDLARKCAWPFRPDAGPRNASTFAASEGQDEHDHIEQTIKTGSTEARTPTHARWLAEFWSPNDHLEWHAETPIAIDPLTGETRLGPADWDRRDYAWAPWRFMVGTPDAWAMETGLDGRVWLRICDWKTGMASHIKDPRTAGQMLFLGLALARHLGHRGPVSLEYVLVNERRLWVEKAQMTRADLLAFQSELARLLTLAADGNPAPVEGHWCRSMWCDYLGRCPATKGALATVDAPEAGPFRVALSEGEITSDEHAAWQYRIIRAAAKKLEEAERAMKARAKTNPIPLGDGRYYGPREKSRESLDVEREGAREVLDRYLGDHARDAVKTKLTASKESIEAACRPLAKARGETIKGLVSKVLVDLRACGALRTTTHTETTEYEAAPGLEHAPEGAQETA